MGKVYMNYSGEKWYATISNDLEDEFKWNVIFKFGDVIRFYEEFQASSTKEGVKKAFQIGLEKITDHIKKMKKIEKQLHHCWEESCENQ